MVIDCVILCLYRMIGPPFLLSVFCTLTLFTILTNHHYHYCSYSRYSISLLMVPLTIMPTGDEYHGYSQPGLPVIDYYHYQYLLHYVVTVKIVVVFGPVMTDII